MLGKFENFPVFAHKEKAFKPNIPAHEAQVRILKLLYALNGKEIPLKKIFKGLDEGVNVIFEIGLADGINFTYLDNSELERYLIALNNGTFKILDFFLVNRYYRVDNGKKQPLKFDYQLVRLEFSNEKIILRLYHEKGPRRIHLDELTDFLAKQLLQASL